MGLPFHHGVPSAQHVTGTQQVLNKYLLNKLFAPLIKLCLKLNHVHLSNTPEQRNRA